MQPDDQSNPSDHLRARMRKYDAYDPSRSYVNHPDPEPTASSQQIPVQPEPEPYQPPTASYTRPHDVRSGYIPPQMSTYSPEPEVYSQPYTPHEPAAMPPQQHYEDPRQKHYYESQPFNNSAANNDYTATAELSSPHKQGGIFGSIVKATVQVERVTRQSVKAVKHTFEPPHISVLRTHRQKFALRSFYAVAVLSMFTAVSLGIHEFAKGSQYSPSSQAVLGAQTNPQNDATRDSEIPSEKVPTTQDIKTYLVAPPYPRYLRIPSMSIESRIRRLGIDSSGAVGTPNNISDAGWYDSSVKPGDKDGTSLIVGHLTGPTAHGVFWDLNKLAVGAKIEIEKGNGELLSYKVTHIESVKSDDFNISDYLKSETPGRNDLRLITSSGKYDSVTVQGSDRYVVFAQQIL